MTGTLVYVPIEEAIKPRDGEVMTNRWWVAKDGSLLFYKMPQGDYLAPQCNSDEAISRSLQEKMYPDHDVVMMNIVFLGHRKDY